MISLSTSSPDTGVGYRKWKGQWGSKWWIMHLLWSNIWAYMWLQWELVGVPHSGPSPWRAASRLRLRWSMLKECEGEGGVLLMRGGRSTHGRRRERNGGGTELLTFWLSEWNRYNWIILYGPLIHSTNYNQIWFRICGDTGIYKQR